jgi:iron complex transport system substrate-binding protein
MFFHFRQNQRHYLLISLLILAGLTPWWLNHMPKANEMQPLPTAFPRYWQDAVGKRMTIPAPPQRIVSQTLATDEILLAICPPQRIVALSALAVEENYSNVVILAKSVTKQAVNNVEHILSLNPDLVFIANYNRAETVELLQATGAPVIRLSQFRHLQDIKKNIATIGYVIGEDERAAALVAKMEQDIQAIRAQIPKRQVPWRVLSYSLGNYTAGRDTTFDEMVKLVGAINVAAENGISGHVKISDEQILLWQPNFIITHAAAKELTLTRQLLLTNSAIAASQAGKAGKIIVIDNRYFLTVSQYVVKGIEALAQGLYAN